jgi:DNA-binding LytR/AlgR family response regulator
MKALIVEDEYPSARRLERLLLNFKVEVLERVPSVEKATTWLQDNPQPDVIFMDVHLSDGLCFEIFEHVTVTSKIIFTTAYSDYSIKAFDYDSISYLLKPIQQESLEKAISKATQIYEQEKGLEEFKELMKNFQLKKYKSSFAVKVGVKIKMIHTKDIPLIYSFENATYIQYDQSNYIVPHSLSSLEQQLNPEHFFRVNRTFMVHVNAIKDIISYTNSRLKLILHSFDESEIIVSRERVKDFKNWIDR